MLMIQSNVVDSQLKNLNKLLHLMGKYSFFHQFINFCNLIRLFPSTTDLKCLHRHFDCNNDGHANIEAFMRSLVDPNLSKRKRAIVDKIWANLDPNGTGSTTGQ